MNSRGELKELTTGNMKTMKKNRFDFILCIICPSPGIIIIITTTVTVTVTVTVNTNVYIESSLLQRPPIAAQLSASTHLKVSELRHLGNAFPLLLFLLLLF